MTKNSNPEPRIPNPYVLECAVWEFTLKCNLNCLHCGSTAGGARGDELNTEEALSLCEDLKKTGCLGVALMGGEPLLRKDFFLVAEKIKALGMDLSIITNGTIFSDEIFEKLKKLKPRALAVSLDASTAEIHDRIRGQKGAFEKTWKFVERGLKEKLPISVITTVHKMNLKELPSMREQIRGKNIAWQIQTAGAEGARFPKDMLLDADEFYSVGIFIESSRRNYPAKELPVIGAHDMGFNSMLMKNITLQNKWRGCEAGISVLGIRSNGDILGCLAINEDEFIEGNIRESSICDLWNNPNGFAYTRNFKLKDTGEYCAGCEYLADCKGGCNEMSLMKTGKVHNDSYCFYKMEQRLFKEELKNPVKRFMLKLSGLKSSLSADRKIKKLSKIFLGDR
ncbi:MAG: radical SAM protein [Elusimicrobiales bacterium]|nr:radical SAM protein [Elusimicrobiales bacterium]